jgi:flagellar basal-body rod protein FlgB
MKLFDTTLARLQSALDIRLERQNVLAGNLANVDTPAYLPRELDFNRALAAAESPRPGGEAALGAGPAREGFIALDAAGPVAPSPSHFVKVASTPAGLDGNGVDLDRTMVELARNALLYGASAKAAGKKLAILRYVASDGIG